MPSISRIRFTNVVYDNGNKRYIDTVFRFDGFNGILLLENGAGKTVFVQTLIQAVLPRKTVAQRKIQETLQLSNNIAHIAVEWILEDQPRRYGLTAVSLFMNNRDTLASQEFAMEYTAASSERLDTLPFTKQEKGHKRPATKEEMAAYFRGIATHSMTAQFFSENDTLTAYGKYIEDHFKLIPSEWNKIAAINETEGGVEAYFESCRTTNDLIDKLLIPTVEEGCADTNGVKEGNGFAELFESQRDHFKQQLVLQQRIEEMKGIISELSDYTEIQHSQYEAEQKLLLVNRKLKALYIQTGAVQKQRKATQGLLEEEADRLHHEQAMNRQRFEACNVAERELVYKEKQDIVTNVKMVRQAADEAYTAALTELHNLELARRKHQYEQAGQSAVTAQQALAALSQHAETVALEAQLSSNGAALHYWFQTEEQKQQQLLGALQQSQQEVQHNKAQQQTNQQRWQQEGNRLHSAVGEKDGRVRTLVEQQEKIEQELFPDSMNRDAKAQYHLWQQEQRQNQQELDGYEKNICFYEDEQQKLNVSLPKQEKEYEGLTEDKQSIDLQIARIDSQAALVLGKLGKWPSCANVAANTLQLYQRSEFLMNQMGDNIVMEEEKARNLETTSRQAHRFLDVYGQQDQFTADPALEEYISDWADDFVYLKSGADMFRLYCREGQDAKILYQAYPFWAASVVTTAEELPKLLTRLQQAAADFFQPVFVLTEQELRAVLDGSSALPQRQVVPAYWQNVIPALFSDWIGSLRDKAAQCDDNWKRQQLVLQELRQTRQDANEFYGSFPFSEFEELGRSRQGINEKMEILSNAIVQGREDLDKCRDSIEKYRKSLYETQNKKIAMQRKLDRAEDYFRLLEQHQQILKERAELLRELTDVEQQAATTAQTLASLQQQHDRILTDMGVCRNALEEIKGKFYYDDVQEVQPQQSGLGYEALAERRRQIKSRLEGADENRGRLESQLQQARKDRKRLEKEIADLHESSETVLDEGFLYPPNGSEREQELRQQRKELQCQCKAEQSKENAAQKASDMAYGSWTAERERYFNQYEEMITFDTDLSHVRKTLENQKKEIAGNIRSCKGHIDENRSQLTGFSELQHQLDQHNVRLQFAIDAVETAILPDEWKTEDYGVLQRAMLPLLADAGAAYTVVEERKAISAKCKDAFIRYCENHIKKEKMRRRIVEGIRSKEGYEEFVIWQHTISSNITHIISLSESERKEHFTHIEHMIEHMTLYLQEMCDGLREIAAKTRIKVGNGTKDIFMVHIAPWKDSDARTAIRAYLNSITTNLDRDEYKDDLGHEDNQKIKAALQKKLRTQQILLHVLGDKAIKVRCRKATSAQLFSDRPYNWEESNKWSGGEMWSKNMALFLGCLNYLSEKRCHVRHRSYNNRVVLADNPFGKASSEHVLNPVFYIAQQLGFQMIALTAHEDGNFIRKYFPVVYSCRFADIPGNKGKVLLPEKEIKTAFFEEHHPESLGRLNDYEEVGLF
ncbi:MAG: hypothetical protein LKF74_03310 [Megasphaera sp.]|nr:hypothetical protein [Megasphaera sp.]MCH4187390.1 hypothetical protein [Megasphaera sp.]MCH4217572.1 hypothetical protein [Megasphaera sp.]